MRDTSRFQSVLTPIPISLSLTSGQTSLILPSLSKANSTLHTPLLLLPRHGDASKYSLNENDVNGFEDFFYNSQKWHKSHVQLEESLKEKLLPHYIQPRSRYLHLNYPSSSVVVDIKKQQQHDEEMGRTGLKINRSTTNLVDLNSATSLSALSKAATGASASSVGAGKLRARSSLNRAPPTFTLHSNSSTNSLAIAEEQEEQKQEVNEAPIEDVFDQDFYILNRRETKLAPFGGFSNPDIEGMLFNQESIFESAPWKVVFAQKGNVSLTKAVKLSVEDGVIHNNKWVGTLAMPSDSIPKHVIDDIAESLSNNYDSEAVFPNDITFQGHYKSFCKQILWPTFHYQIPDDPKSKAFEDHSWSHYKLLNQLVADKIVEVYKKENGEDADPADPENLIWIHDYHLLLVPLMIRQKLPNAKIGLFLHISFPSSEVFRCFAQRTEILRGMLGANCISFQTEEYVRHFLQTCNRLLLADTNEYGISYDGNLTMINTIPVGIDAASLSDVVESEDVKEWRLLIRDRWGGQNLIVSRDKLDKLRGIKQKLLAYEMFLTNNPEYIDTTVLIQICNGSANDSEYESEINQIVARINSLPDNISMSRPVVLLQKDIEFNQYVALQSEAEVFVVSSMREGLNLTCHEFITSTSEKNSPLILSEFTGSASLLNCNGKGSLLINPWDIKKFSETFKRLLTMDKKEKLMRWQNCFEVVLTRDSRHWVQSCLQSINEAWERDYKKNSTSLKRFTKQAFEKFYRDGKKGRRLFFLNLETPVATANPSHPNAHAAVAAAGKNSFSVPATVHAFMSDILEDPRNGVYLMSYLKKKDLDSLYRRYPKLGLIAENGGYIKLIGSSKWISTVDESELQSWMSQVKQLIDSKVERLPGSYCEVEDCTIRFHTGRAFIEDRERTIDTVGDTIQYINSLFQEQDDVHATLIRNVVVVQKNQLSLKALKFIISYYNQMKSGVDPETLIKEYRVKQVSPTAMPTTPDRSYEQLLPLLSPNSGRSQKGVTSIFFSGGSTPIDEPSYEYINFLKDVGELDNALAVVVLGADSDVKTSATHAARGKNELLGILSKATLR